jgi:hypothetical protein
MLHYYITFLDTSANGGSVIRSVGDPLSIVDALSVGGDPRPIIGATSVNLIDRLQFPVSPSRRNTFF